MNLVPAMIQALVRADGHALVLHVGEKPYVATPTRRIEVADRGLAPDAVDEVLAQILPIALQNALDEFGAIEHALPAMAEFPGEQFTLVAVRKADDVWVEIRRRPNLEDDRIPDELFAPMDTPAASAIAAAGASAQPTAGVPPPVVSDDDELPSDFFGSATTAVGQHAAPVTGTTAAAHHESGKPDDDLLLPDEGHLWPGAPRRDG